MEKSFKNPIIYYDNITKWWYIVYKDTIYYRGSTKKDCKYQLYLVNNCGYLLEDLQYQSIQTMFL